MTMWSVLRDSGRSPALTVVPGWTFGRRPALIMRYQLGAADSRAEVYGVNADDTAPRLNMLQGALIEPFEMGDEQLLRVHETADLDGASSCFGWSGRCKKLVQRACNGHQPPDR